MELVCSDLRDLVAIEPKCCLCEALRTTFVDELHPPSCHRTKALRLKQFVYDTWHRPTRTLHKGELSELAIKERFSKIVVGVVQMKEVLVLLAVSGRGSSCFFAESAIVVRF